MGVAVVHDKLLQLETNCLVLSTVSLRQYYYYYYQLWRYFYYADDCKLPTQRQKVPLKKLCYWISHACEPCRKRCAHEFLVCRHSWTNILKSDRQVRVNTARRTVSDPHTSREIFRLEEQSIYITDN